jgi:hypothetical protein
LEFGIWNLEFGINLRSMIRKLLLFALLAGLAFSSCKKLDFTKTEPPSPPGSDTWLYYDNGLNFTGISANSGGDFDIAIRISSSDLTDYDGYLIDQVKFYPLEGYPATYSVEIWEGNEPPTLVKIQDVSVYSDMWNTTYLDEDVYVDASKDLWVGLWVQDYPSGTYPAGCDEGPAVTGKGDLYSVDGGLSWSSLSSTDGLDYNWNLEVYVTAPILKKSGLESEQIPLVRQPEKTLRSIVPQAVNQGMSSLKGN